MPTSEDEGLTDPRMCPYKGLPPPGVGHDCSGGREPQGLQRNALGVKGTGKQGECERGWCARLSLLAAFSPPLRGVPPHHHHHLPARPPFCRVDGESLVVSTAEPGRREQSRWVCPPLRWSLGWSWKTTPRGTGAPPAAWTVAPATALERGGEKPRTCCQRTRGSTGCSDPAPTCWGHLGGTPASRSPLLVRSGGPGALWGLGGIGSIRLSARCPAADKAPGADKWSLPHPGSCSGQVWP